MGRAHAAAEGDVEADQCAILDDGNEAQVIGEHVHVVGGWHGESHLELARQVGAAVDRFLFLAAAGHELLVQPDFVIGARIGQEVLRQHFGPLLYFGMRARFMRVGRHHHVAVDVAARGQGIDQRGIDGLHGRLELALDHAVELERLARGDAQRVVGVLRSNGIQLQPLRWSDHAARRAGADHELVGRFQLLAATLIADIAVVLLIAAVVLDQGLVGLAQRTRNRIGQAVQQAATQALAFGFDVFDGVIAHGVSARQMQSGGCGLQPPSLQSLRLEAAPTG